ncbi:MAG: pantoate--beta-alanine ligase [Vampirovibrionales bacterium]|nr:pantoate--beta-alanine ligase [Vampirovibrionales bacterium]
MQRLETLEATQAFVAANRTHTVALVPTMGALHEGHRALIRHAKTLADIVVVSIYVNPLQFGPNEDLATYPRTLEDDAAACQAEDADALFLPTDAMMYPNGQLEQTLVAPPISLTNMACGASRPGHFVGVCTVVLKLFNLIQPTIAVFGEKDAQQLTILKRMVADLNVPVQLIGHPIVREDQGPLKGLALSSRNKHLVDTLDQQAALLLNEWLIAIETLVKQSGPISSYTSFGTARQQVFANIDPTVAERFKLDYLLAVDDATFQPVDTLKPGVRLLMAAHIGSSENTVRLIDNRLLS